jgi:hypothetical protein
MWKFPFSVSKVANFQRTHNRKLFQRISFLHCSPFLIGHKLVFNLEQDLQKVESEKRANFVV